MKTEQELEAEFDRLYENGDVGLGVLDDDLPDFKADWVAMKLERQAKIED